MNSTGPTPKEKTMRDMPLVCRRLVKNADLPLLRPKRPAGPAPLDMYIHLHYTKEG